ncbi:GTP-binding protein Rho1 [Linderina macrospora]|uniref:GTP-binding protein Rho1 n=1 Tax=Linderina macrospora TaxID=4868 RepID=A0ACC1IYV6_9FUNG|nr:GTP-binding protein Rho1 [Linderina macrospora]
MGDYSKNIIQRKAIVIGDGACGKTCLLHVFRMGKFPDDDRYIPTVFDAWVADMEVNNQPVELALWDTAGQEEFDRLRLLCYPDASVVVICFSVDSPDSLDNVEEKWYAESSMQALGAPTILVALKLDLRNDQRTVNELARYGQHPVSQAEGQRMAERIGAVAYVECSSIQNLNVRQVFELAARAAVIPKGKRKNDVASNDCCVIL